MITEISCLWEISETKKQLSNRTMQSGVLYLEILIKYLYKTTFVIRRKKNF